MSLYASYDLGRLSAFPFAQAHAAAFRTLGAFAEITNQPAVRIPAASALLASRLLASYPKPAWNLHRITDADGQDLSVETVVEAERPFGRLLHFKRTPERRQDPPLLIVAPLSGHYATLLRDTVTACLKDHDVWVTDWSCASQVPVSAGAFGLDGYIDYIIGYMRHLGPGLNVLAVCQPTVPVLAATALLHDDPCAPATITLMSGPIDTAAAPTEVTALADRYPISWFEERMIHTVPLWRPGAGRRVYPGFIQLAAFMAMQKERHIAEHCQLWGNYARGDDDKVARHVRFYDEYLAVLDLDADFYIDTVERVFQQRELAQGRMFWRGTLVEPSRITRTALMTVEAEEDDISAPGQTVAAQRLCSSIPETRRCHWLQPEAGHYGSFSGSKWRNEIRPRIASFIRANAG